MATNNTFINMRCVELKNEFKFRVLPLRFDGRAKKSNSGMLKLQPWLADWVRLVERSEK